MSIDKEKYDAKRIHRDAVKKEVLSEFSEKFGDDPQLYFSYMEHINGPEFRKWYKKHPKEHAASKCAIFYRLLTPKRIRLLEELRDAERDLLDSYLSMKKDV